MPESNTDTEARKSATVVGTGLFGDAPPETTLTITDNTEERIFRGVEFSLHWGKKGFREFMLTESGEIRSLARVLAAAAGTALADEDGDSGA